MPELPDITVYLEAIERRIVGQVLEKIRMEDIFVLRTARPPIDSLEKRRVTALRRLGKRLAIGFEGDRWLVIHLMIAGRLQWAPAKVGMKARNALAHFVFSSGTLTLTEAGTKRRASLHVLEGEAALQEHDRGGLDVFRCSEAEFARALTTENHTLKRSLTDPRLFSGIGNAYSDEILHAAKLSPVTLTQKLSGAEMARLLQSTREVLRLWTERLRTEVGEGFPERSPRSVPRWPCMGNLENHVRSAARRCSEFATPRMK